MATPKTIDLDLKNEIYNKNKNDETTTDKRDQQNQ